MSIVTIGNFDGVHLGHQFLLMKTVALAKLFGKKSIVYTFTPHTHKKMRLMSDLQKVKFFKHFAVEEIVLQNFCKEFANLNPDEFIDLILLKQLKATHVVIGSNFTFGANADGGVRTLTNRSKIETLIVEPILIGVSNSICSSSITRTAIESGNLNFAKQLLGRPYSLSGNVVVGEGRGRMLGYPTANLAFEQGVLPPLGVYAIHDNYMRFGIANVGKRPTFANENNICVEIHFLDFNENLYGKRVEIFLDLLIREEMHFSSVEKLKRQISNDIKTVKEFYQNKYSISQENAFI